MSTSIYAVRVSPGELHFNAAHFITFNGVCENIHGHNFHVRIEARGDNTGDAFVVDFVLLNRLAAAICRELHDGVLVPQSGDEIAVEVRDDDLVEIRSYGKQFILSRTSCILLPIPNTTAEMLARHISDRLLTELRANEALGNLNFLEVAVEEADNQWGVCGRVIEHA
ncbi:MAG: 6-carboxytetrahydropterin synthase [Chromatiaceae bacterium]|nr:6-carboxytetrahydropterin synthase [Gammaproteobacteria bacterium]MCP5304524.1 6-carboxytetrahydropterin synthase [Chromatiaceae bacterium]MCP5314252.1 6-carboxytetrahydropterin synthase [Chromatiaceae bacterium]